MKTRWIPTLALAALCAFSLPSLAQAPAVSGIAHVAYRVGNLDQALAFYRKLGFEESFAFANPGRPAQVFVKVNDRQFIEVYAQADPPQPLGWMHLCYESDAIDSLHALYVAHGLNPPPVARAGAGNLIFSLKDPEGRVTEFTQYMPGSRHTLDRGRHLGANRVAEQLLGITLPVPDLAAARQFYAAGLGFQVQQRKAGLRVLIPGGVAPWIDLFPSKSGGKPEVVFEVRDAAGAARALRARGLAVTLNGRRVLVHDPDGNILAFAENRAY
jgi:catechol 2,3-dioxygenase-like lactoylglutathione lyase family enzyme